MKCLAKDRHNVEELVVPEVSYTSIFTAGWLKGINGERMGAILENCLLATDNKIFRVPWEEIVNPEFVDKPPRLERHIRSERLSSSGFSEVHPESVSSEVGPQALHEPGDNLLRARMTDKPASAGDSSREPVSLTVLGEVSRSNPEGEYVELLGVALPQFGLQRDSLTQSLVFSYCTNPRMKAKQRFVASPKSDACLKSGVCLVPHNQLDTARTSDVRVDCADSCLENGNATGSDTFLLKKQRGPEQNPASVFPTVASASSGTEEDSPGKLQTHLEHELDWRYAMCSYSDGEEAERKPLTAAAAVQRNSSEAANGSRTPECCSGAPGIEVAWRGPLHMESSPQRDQEGSVSPGKGECSGSPVESLGACCSFDEGSGSSRPSLSLPTTHPVLPEPFSSEKVAHSHPTQELSDGVTSNCSGRLVECHLSTFNSENEKVSSRQASGLLGLDSGEATPQENLPGDEKECSPGNLLPLQEQTGGDLLQEDRRESLDYCEQQVQGALLLCCSEAMHHSPMAKQESKSSSSTSSPSAETGTWAEVASGQINMAEAAVSEMDQPCLPSEPKSLPLGNSMEVDCLTRQREESDQNTPAIPEPDHWTPQEAGCKPGPCKAPAQQQCSEPGEEREDTPAPAPLTPRVFPDNVNCLPQTSSEASSNRGRTLYGTPYASFWQGGFCTSIVENRRDAMV